MCITRTVLRLVWTEVVLLSKRKLLKVLAIVCGRPFVADRIVLNWLLRRLLTHLRICARDPVVPLVFQLVPEPYPCP